LLLLACLAGCWLGRPAPAGARGQEQPEHFVQGEMRAGLSWDNILAMETGLLKFGGSYGLYVLNGIELGFEQQFIVPPNSGAEARSWGYLRAVPVRDWPVTPFVCVRAGYYDLPEDSAAALGAGLGLVMFVDSTFAFEATGFAQAVIDPRGGVNRQTEFDWRMVVYF
jgi:hypothetical protein